MDSGLPRCAPAPDGISYCGSIPAALTGAAHLVISAATWARGSSGVGGGGLDPDRGSTVSRIPTLLHSRHGCRIIKSLSGPGAQMRFVVFMVAALCSGCVTNETVRFQAKPQ